MAVDPTQAEEVGLGQISDSVVADNLKTVAGASAFYSAQAMRSFVGHQNRLEILAEANLSRATRATIEEDPMEAVAAQKILSGNDLGSTLAALGAVVAQLQQVMKGAQTTPPNTTG